MKRKTLKWLHNLLGLCILAGVTVGCVMGDEGEYLTDPQEKGNEKEVTFSLNLPGDGKQPASYALEETDETDVKEVAVLLFNKNASSMLSYLPIYCNTFVPIGGERTFTVKIPEGNYNMVVIANAAPEVKAAVMLGAGTGIAVGMEKEIILANLTVTHNSAWVSNTNAQGYRMIPMWGEVDLNVNKNTTATTVKLVRMLSRIDVVVTGTATQAKFKMKNIRLCNYYDKGRIAPSENNIGSDMIATAPSIPDNAAKTSSFTPLIYNSSTAVISDVKCEREIYTFETDKKTNPVNYEDGTCLVIGGYYNNSSTMSYYRVDFANAAGNYIDLLRNHHYIVAIKDITGPGYSNPEEAYKSAPLNIIVNVLTWSDTEMTEIVYNNEYLLAVSQGFWSFGSDKQDDKSGDNILKVYTDYTSGWDITKITDENGVVIDWLDVDKKKGEANSKTNVCLELDENKTGQNRTGYIHIIAGPLMYKVEVIQSGDQTIHVTSISVSPESATVYKGGTILLIAKIEPKDASDKTVAWTSSDQSVATVDNSGKVSTIKAGVAIITAIADGQSATSTITVVEGPYIPGTHNGWAGSNIYYDEHKGHMTFADLGDSKDDIQSYQGVYFKWGSLYGIAAYPDLFKTSLKVYAPSGGWRDNYTSWSNIKYAPGNEGTNDERGYLYEITNESEGIGDICRYLTEKGFAPGAADGKRWRMPTSKEFQSTSLRVYRDDKYVANESGTGLRQNGHKISKDEDIAFFPFSGYRNESTGHLALGSTKGYYWSSSPSRGDDYAHELYLDKDSYKPNEETKKAQGNPVRCVLEK